MVSQVAERYGQALFELALEMNSLEAWQNQAKGIIEVFKSNPELSDFFGAVKISNAEKTKMIHTLFDGRIDRMMIHFLCLLQDKKRMNKTGEILQQFILLGNQERGILNGTVLSARKLSKEEIERIEEAMTARMKKKVELVNRVDASLISGVRVVIGNEVIDGSMKSRIETLKNELLKESR